MKNLQFGLCLLLAILLPRFASASLVGPYTPDANTPFLLHLDGGSGGSVTTNVGFLGGNFITANFSSATGALPAVNTMLGFPSYSTNSPTTISFDNCESNQTSGYMLGYDYNRDGIYEGDSGSATPPSPSDYLPMSNLGIGNGGQTPFTLEALICPSGTAFLNSGVNQDIVSTDSHDSVRGFFFRLAGGTLAFQYVGGGSLTSQALQGNIPTVAQDPENGVVANTWYHVAFTYDGTNGTIYWTKLDPSLGAAHVLATGPLTMGAAYGTNIGPLGIGNRARSAGSETFLGAVDEVRISSVCRAANQMQFFSPLVTITQNPISQNVDYNQPATFTVGATTSGSTLGYQWQLNSNKIAGATSATYSIPNVAAANAGYYDCIVTNTAGNMATSTVAQLVVGAANFLNHRYSFITNFTNGVTGTVTTLDSIAGADGTNFGDAFEASGELVLDGTTGTYLQLPSGIVNGANQTALTVEFWATFGSNPNNVYAFNFGTINTGVLEGHAFLGYSPHNANGQEMFISPADFGFAETNAAPGTLDSEAVHVACVFDAPNQIMSIYTNGALASSASDTVGLANINDVYSYIGASLNSGDPYLAANFSELRIYNGALSPLSIAQSQVQGPGIVLASGPASFVVQPVGTSVPVGWTATFSAAATGYLPITYQWFKNGTLVPGATNATYSFAAALGDNNDSILCHATNTIGVTTYVTNSATAILMVFSPPTLSWLGTGDGGANNTWDTSSLDWTNDLAGGGVIAFAQTNGVLFDDRSGGGAVDLEQTNIPYSITVNTADGYMFTSGGGLGSLAGPSTLTKTGSGTLDIDLTNDLSGLVTITGGELQVGNGDASGSLGSSPVTNNATLSFNRSDTALVVHNPIHGTGILSFDGGGAVAINGSSDYTGATLLNQGIVYLNSGTGFGDTTGATVANNAQLYITANINVATPLTLNGTGDGNGALRKGGAGTTVCTGLVTMASDSSIGVDSGATLVVSNTVSGTGQLTALGSGTLALAVPDTYPNGTVINGPTVDINTGGSLGTGLLTFGDSGGKLVLATGITFSNAADAQVVNPGADNGVFMVNDNTNGTVTTISGPLEFDGSATSGGCFVGPTTSGYLNITGPISNPVTGLISARSGLLRFSGGGSYTTIYVTGTTSIGANNGLSTSAEMTVGPSGAGTFDLNGFSQILTGLSDGQNPAGAELVTNSAAGAATLTLNLSSGLTYSGVIAGNISLVVEGSANEDLSGTNSYTGNTTVSGGSLELAQPTLAAGSTVTIASGAFLQLDFTSTNNIAGLVLNGVSQPAGIYNATTSSPYLVGSGTLQVTPFIATSSPTIIAVANGSTLSLSWPPDHKGWIVQSNSVSLSVPSDWQDIPATANGTNYNPTINPAQPQVFYRLRYP